MVSKTTITMFPSNYSGGEGQTIEVLPAAAAEMLDKGWTKKDPRPAEKKAADDQSSAAAAPVTATAPDGGEAPKEGKKPAKKSPSK